MREEEKITVSQTVTYVIDPSHSTAGFKVRHLMVSNVRGEFSGVSGTAVFEAEKFPKITFTSKKVMPVGEGEWRVVGDLTIHGVTKEAVLDVEGPTPEVKDPWGNTKIGATATTKLDRRDFGLVFNMALEAGGVMVGDAVAIDLELELTRQK